MGRFPRWLTFVSLFCAAGVAVGDDYRYEIDTVAGYWDDGDQVRRLWNAGVTAYLAPVDPGRAPLAEAPFLARIGSASLSAGRRYTRFAGGLEAEGPEGRAGLVYRRPDLPVDFKLDYEYADQRFESPVHDNLSLHTVSAGAGYYLFGSTRIGLDLARSQGDVPAAVDDVVPENRRELQLSFKQLRALGYGGQAVNIEARAIWAEDEYGQYDVGRREWRLGGDYYPEPRIGVGGVLEWLREDRAGDDGWFAAARARLFVTPQASLSAVLGIGRRAEASVGSARFNFALRF